MATASSRKRAHRSSDTDRHRFAAHSPLSPSHRPTSASLNGPWRPTRRPPRHSPPTAFLSRPCARLGLPDEGPPLLLVRTAGSLGPEPRAGVSAVAGPTSAIALSTRSATHRRRSLAARSRCSAHAASSWPQPVRAESRVRGHEAPGSRRRRRDRARRPRLAVASTRLLFEHDAVELAAGVVLRVARSPDSAFAARVRRACAALDRGHRRAGGSPPCVSTYGTAQVRLAVRDPRPIPLGSGESTVFERADTRRVESLGH